MDTDRKEEGSPVSLLTIFYLVFIVQFYPAAAIFPTGAASRQFRNQF